MQLVLDFEGSTFILVAFFGFSEDVVRVFELLWNVFLHSFGYRSSCVGEGAGQGSDFTEETLDAFLRVHCGIDDLGQPLDLADAHRWKSAECRRNGLVLFRLTTLAILVVLIGFVVVVIVVVLLLLS